MADRAAAIAYVSELSGEILADAGLTLTDALGGLKLPLDQATSGTLLALVVGDLPDDDLVREQAAFEALTDLFALRLARRRIAMRFDVGISGDNFRLSQAVDRLATLIAEAEARALYLAGASAVFGGEAAVSEQEPLPQAGTIDIDWSGGPAGEEFARW